MPNKILSLESRTRAGELTHLERAFHVSAAHILFGSLILHVKPGHCAFCGCFAYCLCASWVPGVGRDQKRALHAQELEWL